MREEPLVCLAGAAIVLLSATIFGAGLVPIERQACVLRRCRNPVKFLVSINHNWRIFGVSNLAKITGDQSMDGPLRDWVGRPM